MSLQTPSPPRAGAGSPLKNRGGGTPGAPAAARTGAGEIDQVLLLAAASQSPTRSPLSCSRRCCCRAGCGHLVAGQQHRDALRAEQVTRKLRTCLARSSLTAGSSDGPSAPQFRTGCSSLPSRLKSRWPRVLAVSDQVAEREPSWQVTKLTDATGRRPLVSYSRWTRSAGRRTRAASRLAAPEVAHRVRYLPFHSVHSGGNLRPGSRPGPRPKARR